MQALRISKQTARRYILGRQGLWPGRRFQGEAGTASALRQAEAVQIDTINVIARSHDITLWSRVADYQPSYLNTLCYTRREFFDYGRILMAYPFAELPFWQTVMAAERTRMQEREAQHPEAFAHVRDEIRRRGPLASRDFAERKRIRGGFNTVKDTSHALYGLWLGGHLMTHGRRNFERLHDFFENVAGHAFGANAVAPPEARRHFLRKAVRDVGLGTAAEIARRFAVYWQHRPDLHTVRMEQQTLIQAGAVAAVEVEALREPYYLSAEDLPLLADLEAGRIPQAWQPQHATTAEINLLAPLDNVIWDRARVRTLFDFEYVWEVYKPAAQRRWGYYTLPILFDDRLVARIALRLNRKANTLDIEGFWPEDSNLLASRTFQAALEAGLHRFARFHSASQPDFTMIANGARSEHDL